MLHRATFLVLVAGHLAAVTLATAVTGSSSPVHHATKAPATPEFNRRLSEAGIPVTVLQSVAISKSTPPLLQATVQLRGMRAAAFSAQSTQLRFRQAVAQVLLQCDVLYSQVQITNVRDVLSAGAHSRQLQQVLGFRTLLPVAEVSLQVLNVSSTAAGAAAAVKALDEAVADSTALLGELVSRGLDTVYWTSLAHMTTIIVDSWASSLCFHSSRWLAMAAGLVSVLVVNILAT